MRCFFCAGSNLVHTYVLNKVYRHRPLYYKPKLSLKHYYTYKCFKCNISFNYKYFFIHKKKYNNVLLNILYKIE